jgi:hypothetical protein
MTISNEALNALLGAIEEHVEWLEDEPYSDPKNGIEEYDHWCGVQTALTQLWLDRLGGVIEPT